VWRGVSRNSTVAQLLFGQSSALFCATLSRECCERWLVNSFYATKLQCATCTKSRDKIEGVTSVLLTLLCVVTSIIFIFIHRNGTKKYNNTKTIKSESKKDANDLTMQVNSCKALPVTIYDIYSSINQLISNNTDKDIRRYRGSWKSLCNWLSHNSYFMQKDLTLSVIIALGSLKPNASWISVTICMSLVLKSFIRNRLTEKSSDLRFVLFKWQASRPYSRMGRHLVLINFWTKDWQQWMLTTTTLMISNWFRS